MSRIVTALFASRDEAEAARMRLSSTVKVESARVIGRDTAGALVGLPIGAQQMSSLNEGLKRGDHVVLATVARGADPRRIVEALSVASADVPRVEPQLSYSIGGADDQKPATIPAPDRTLPEAAATPAREADTLSPPHREPPLPAPQARAEASPAANNDRLANQASADGDQEELRIGKSRLIRSGARAPEGVEREFESRTPARRLSDEEVRASGLLKDRVIEVVEMREEPVISREVVVREEVLIRKAANARSDAAGSTRREFEDLPSRD